MDLALLDSKKQAEKGARLYFINPATGEEMDIFMDVLGRDSSKWINMEREDLLKNVNKKTSKKKATEDDAIEIEDNITIKLAKMVTKFGDKDEKGKDLDYITFGADKLKFNFDNVYFLLDKLPWMKEQVNLFIGDRANFL